VTRARRFGILVPLAIFAITVAAFIPALQGQFLNWDDSTLFTKNHDFRGLGGPQLRWMFTTTLAGHYMPLTWLTLGLNYALGGMDPWGYHLAALLLHATNAALFYLVARRILAAAAGPAETGGAGVGGYPAEVTAGAALAALVFAIHPQRVESVAWVTERGTLVSGVLYLVAGLGYLRAVATSGAIRWRWWGVCSVAAYAGALLGKGMAIGLAVTLLILDVYPLRRARGRWWAMIREKTPYFLVAGLGALLILFARNRGAEWSAFSQFGIDARLALAAYSFWFYPASTIWPIGLSPLHEVPVSPDLLQARFLAPFLGLLAVTAILVVLRRRVPGALAAWAHSAVVVLPVSGIAHSGSQLVSDRYSYLAGLGWALLAGYGVIWATRLRRRGRLSRWVSAVGVSGVGLLVAALAVGTWGQSGTWRDSETLWRWATEQDPACAMCEAILGEAIVYGAPGGRVRLDEGEAHVRRAIALRPTMPLPHYTLGTMRLARGEYADAEASLRTYIRLAPGLSQGPARLALIYLVQGRVTDALPLLRRARELEHRPPGDPNPPAAAPGSTGTDDPAFVEAVRLLGDRSEDLEYLGQALVQQGKAAMAVLPLERASALAPSSASPRVWLVQAYEAAGRPDRAREELAVLRRLDPVAAGRLSVR
jgi:Flp pilus assembly protein TadD